MTIEQAKTIVPATALDYLEKLRLDAADPACPVKIKAC